MNVPMAIDGAAHGSELPVNGLRLARTLVRRDMELQVFLMVDAVVAAIGGQHRRDDDEHPDRLVSF